MGEVYVLRYFNTKTGSLHNLRIDLTVTVEEEVGQLISVRGRREV